LRFQPVDFANDDKKTVRTLVERLHRSNLIFNQIEPYHAQQLK